MSAKMSTDIGREEGQMSFAVLNGRPLVDKSGKEIGRVPLAGHMPHNYRGKWGYDSVGRCTFACFTNGMLGVRSGQPDDQEVAELNRLCPRGTLSVPLYRNTSNRMAERVLKALTQPPWEDD